MARTELENHLAYGVDEKTRKIFFGVPIDSSHSGHEHVSTDSIGHVIRAMDKMITDYPKKPIEIHMNSYGGDPYSLLYLHDYILASSCQVKFYGGGAIMSAATWIMAVCDERYLYPNTTVMVHNGWEGEEASYSDFHIFADESKRLQELLYKIYADNSHMPKDFWREVCQRDLYLTAKETISLGLADKIIEPKKRGNFRKMRDHLLNKTPDQKTLTAISNRLLARIGQNKLTKIVIQAHQNSEIDENLTIDETPVVEPAKAEIKNESKE